MPILGAHMSIAGGYHRAIERAADCGCDCVQLFTKNNNQWRAKEITPDEATRFRSTLAERRIKHPIAHDSYLINLASPDPELWRRSVEAFVAELHRADLLGIPYVITHPGAYTTSSEEVGLTRVIEALDEIECQTSGLGTMPLLENTAGQGSCLGWQFEQLGRILAGVRNPDRLGVCFDTCHAFAAGYEFATPSQYRAMMRNLDATVGLGQIRAFHLNDSLRPPGSRVDRHAHIGRGHMGLEPFRRLLTDRRFRSVPMYLETPKETEGGTDMDVINLGVLRGLASRSRR